VWVGTFIENKLNEMDESEDSSGIKRFRPKYKLEDFLDGKPPKEVKQSIPSAAEMRRMSGVVVR
jgi:hypothetical protein